MQTIAVGANGRNLEAKVSPLFGRARFFILVDPDTLTWEVLDNLTHLLNPRGIGVAVANHLVSRNIRTVLAGSCGPKAFQTLENAGVEVVLHVRGTVRQALARLQRGELRRASGPNIRVSS